MSLTQSETDIPGKLMSVVSGTPLLEADLYSKEEISKVQELSESLVYEPKPPKDNSEGKRKRRQRLWDKVERLTKGGGI